MRTAAHTQIALILASFVMGACTSDPEARLRFEDPGVRGNLMDFDRPIVPEGFRGLWANAPGACRHTPDGVLLYVYDEMVGDMAVVRVAGYSDDETAIRIDLASPYGAATYDFYFELALDEAHMRVTGRGEPTPTLFYKCP